MTASTSHTDAALAAARQTAGTAGRAADLAGAAHAAARARVAGLLVAAALPTAAVLVFERDEHVVTAETSIDLVCVRDTDDRLLWYAAAHAFTEHPHARTLGMPPVVDQAVLDEVRLHLTVAYDASPGHFAPSVDGAEVVGEYANLLELPIAAGPPARPDRAVTIELPGGAVLPVALTGDATVVALVDDTPVIGLDTAGAGWWPDGQIWHRLTPGGQLVAREIEVYGLSKAQFYGLSRLLGRPRAWFGRFKGARHSFHFDTSADSCGSDAGLDLVIDELRRHRRPYAETRTLRYQP